MLNFMNSWVSGIVVAVIIGTLLEMILPEGKNKKYVKTVIGFFILFTIVSPVITKFSGETIDLSDIYEYENYVPTNTVAVSSIAQNESIEQVYIDSLKKDIKQNLSTKGYQVKEIDLKISIDEANYGEIVSLIIDIEELKENVVVEPIVIGEDTLKKENTISESKRKEVINYISMTYQITEDKIKVN